MKRVLLNIVETNLLFPRSSRLMDFEVLEETKTHVKVKINRYSGPEWIKKKNVVEWIDEGE